MLTRIRHVAAAAFFVFGLIAQFLIMHVRPFFDGVVCLSFWGVAFLLLLPDELRGRSVPLRLLFLLMAFVAATLPNAWEFEKQYYEQIKRRAQEIERRMAEVQQDFR